MDQRGAYHGLEVISASNYTEYRFYANSSRRRKADERSRSCGQVPLAFQYLWLDALIIGLVSYLLSLHSRWNSCIAIGVCIIYAYWRSTRLIYESVIVFPPHGVQLETHRGAFGSLFVSRRFIPAVYIQDIIINEALRRWNVRYYLAVIVACPGQNIELAVAFENTLPKFPVLHKVYRGVTDALYKECPFSSD